MLACAAATLVRFRVVGLASRYGEARQRLGRMNPPPAVVLLDIGAEGLAAARELCNAVPDVALVALSVDDSDESVIACAETGVAGFVTTDTSLESLMATVLCVAGGGTRCSARATAVLMHRVAVLSEREHPVPSRARLTPRERQIVGLIDQGQSNKQDRKSVV
jgi:two-component system, NarL family, nitrate/nitrite response regulator NarL